MKNMKILSRCLKIPASLFCLTKTWLAKTMRHLQSKSKKNGNVLESLQEKYGTDDELLELILIQLYKDKLDSLFEDHELDEIADMMLCYKQSGYFDRTAHGLLWHERYREAKVDGKADQFIKANNVSKYFFS